MAKSRSTRPQQDFTRYHEKLKAEARAARATAQVVSVCRLHVPDPHWPGSCLRFSLQPWVPVLASMRVECVAWTKAVLCEVPQARKRHVMVNASHSLNRTIYRHPLSFHVNPLISMANVGGGNFTAGSLSRGPTRTGLSCSVCSSEG